jgi:hypothetical protein
VVLVVVLGQGGSGWVDGAGLRWAIGRLVVLVVLLG